MRTESHVGKRNVASDLTNAEGQVSLNIGLVGQVKGERRHDPDVRRAGVQLDGELFATKRDIRSILSTESIKQNIIKS